MREPTDTLPEFVPCAMYFPEQHCTEIVLKDEAIVWVEGIAFDLGYGFDGSLIAVRVPGDRTRR